jgi:ATP-dependent helicase Lhr and Lhr-like helicase
MLHIDLPRVSPLAVPVLVLVGNERVATGTIDDQLLLEADALAAEAMRVD